MANAYPFKTKEITFGSKTYLIRESPPLKFIDDLTRKLRKIKQIEDEEAREDASDGLVNDLLRQMLVKPRFTQEYYDNEADMDDWELGMQMFAEFKAIIELRTADLKKKPAELLGNPIMGLPRSLKETLKLSRGITSSTSATRSSSPGKST